MLYAHLEAVSGRHLGDVQALADETPYVLEVRLKLHHLQDIWDSVL